MNHATNQTGCYCDTSGCPNCNPRKWTSDGLTPGSTWQPSREEYQRERRMADILLAMHQEPDIMKARHLSHQYWDLHAQRSPEYIEYLERRRRLFRG